jgi:hypothetical protein
MRTYLATSLDRPGVTARLDWGGPNGFHAVVLGPTGTYFVDPAAPGEFSRYAAYHKGDNVAAQPLQCDGGDLTTGSGMSSALVSPAAASSTGGNLRSYRFAFAVTGDYTVELAGGDVAVAQANAVTITNRVNATFERELSVRLLLIGNNADIVYGDPDTDPYTQGDTGAMLDENQTNLDAVIGTGNYDIGHVMYRGGSGRAFLNSPCNGSLKARAVSGVFQATGDSIVVEMIAHELGHQFGARHTFNSELGFCSGNRTGSSAWEPGSGTTIMSYSGICNEDNVQSFSNDYFHGGSLDQMLNFVAAGGSCAAVARAGNANAPIVSATGGYTIPVGTPFELDVDSASDADGDTLTFSWEQFDLGQAATLAEGDNGDNPLVRSLPPAFDSLRMVTGEALGETLPTTTRALNFRVTARDNAAGGGRVGEANITLNTDASIGPFAVTFPNGGERLTSANPPTVTWNVAGTNGAPVNTATVDILLSTDGGQTYGTTLAAGVPNDGAQEVVLPAVNSATARIKIKAAGNIYFDASDANFSLNAFEQCVSPDTTIPAFTPVSEDLVVTGRPETISDLDVRLQVSYPVVGALVATLEHVDTGTSVKLVSRPGVDEVNNPGDFGCQTSDIDATLDDEGVSAAENACNLSPPALSGELTPFEPLAAFDGETLNGTWRLTVSESTYSWTGGSPNVFNGFCIQAPLAVQNPPPPPPPPPASLILKSGFEGNE